MAGITNTAFRRLCREAMASELAPGQAGGLFVSEMITSRALVERNPKTLQLIRFEPDESPRSIQLYGVDPAVVGAAVRMIVDEDLADHVDLNFGCPVPEGDPQGRGSGAAVRASGCSTTSCGPRSARPAAPCPVTVKMRVGIDADHVTYREAGLRAQDAGVAHVALHGRTAEEYYGGHADWSRIADLADLLDIPVLGNGDIWEGEDAVRMVRETGCAGVVVGRGCLGRPWLFADLAAAFAGRDVADAPDARRGRRDHAPARRTAGGLDRRAARRDRVPQARRLVPQGLRRRRRAAGGAGAVVLAGELDDLLARLDPAQPFPEVVLGQPRGRTTGGRGVSLPEGWLDSADSRDVPFGAELTDGGG